MSEISGEALGVIIVVVLALVYLVCQAVARLEWRRGQEVESASFPNKFSKLRIPPMPPPMSEKDREAKSLKAYHELLAREPLLAKHLNDAATRFMDSFGRVTGLGKVEAADREALEARVVEALEDYGKAKANLTEELDKLKAKDQASLSEDQTGE